ncbi:MAG TPA: FKBP-type peptidyl-prolyl cis-trans isomerase [Acidimicrobiales bacterium]|nr:FKBP-type peptidyl-prolyl cis-trans isomerase [Acidimicrobiales bacterium]
MSPTKRDRQKELRRAKQARQAALARARARRQRLVRAVLGGVALLAVVAFVVTRAGDDATEVETAATTTVPEPVESAAGKPCVPVADTAPPGVPAVPVKVGPPPAQLVREDLKPGTGATVGANDTVTVHYIGVSCSTGMIFDSSYSRGQPATFPLTGVIKGWTEGIPGMAVGGQRLLGIPPELGYGPQGSPPDIAPGETLWFVVEIVDTKAV